LKFNEFIKHLIARPVGTQLFWLYIIGYSDKPISISEASKHAGISPMHGIRVLKWGEDILKQLKIPFSKTDNGNRTIFSFKETQQTELTEEQKLHLRICVGAIEYLNRETSKAFLTGLEKNQKDLKARLKEGFTAIQVKTVIDTKVKEWKGTEREKYLRPETLFGKKFESYLYQNQNEQTNSKKLTGDELAKANIAIGRDVARGLFKTDPPAE